MCSAQNYVETALPKMSDLGGQAMQIRDMWCLQAPQAMVRVAIYAHGVPQHPGSGWGRFGAVPGSM